MAALMDMPDDYEPQEQAQAPQVSPALVLQAIMQIPNIAAVLEEEKLSGISQKVIREYQIDKSSRSDWEKRTATAMDLAMMVAEQKNYPFENASNIKFPLLTTAALQFNARAYPAIVQGNRVAKCVTWGRDPNGAKAARADRVGEHLSYQLLSELTEWEEDTDRMLVMLPISGCVFRKVYYDPSVRRNVTRLVTADRLVVNYFARSLEDTPRTTEEMRLYPYEIQERIRDGRFVQFDYGVAGLEPDSDGKDQPDAEDEDAPHLFLEQHRLLDLDDDGYPEPYVVTVHHASQKVCRIVANFGPESVTAGEDGKVSAIRKNAYYVKYQFLPSPDGGFYGWGFGWLLKDIGESINTTLNQMMDAGHLSNIQGGLVSSVLGIKEKSIKLKMGEWRVINTSAPLNQAVMPIKYDGPSAVLFNLLGMLVEAGKEVASIKDVLTGDTPATAPVGTTLAIIEQGLQVFTSIYKRIHRAIKAELGLHAKLNRANLDPQRYAAFFDGEDQVDPQADYSEDDMDILPISDPTMVSRMQQIAKAQLLKEWATENPMANQLEVSKRILEAAQIEDPEKLILPPPEPNPEEEILKRVVAMLAVRKQESEILKDETAALKNVADAEAAEEGTQLALYQSFLQFLQSQESQDGQGRPSGMEGASGNAMGAGPAQNAFGGMGAGPEGPAVPVGIDATGMGGNAGGGGLPEGAL